MQVLKSFARFLKEKLRPGKPFLRDEADRQEKIFFKKTLI